MKYNGHPAGELNSACVISHPSKAPFKGLLTWLEKNNKKNIYMGNI